MKLAIDGGIPIKTTPFGKGKRFGSEELVQLSEALEQNTLFYAHGQKVKAFTKKFAAMYSVPYCVGVSSGTASVHTALGALGIKPGDEVITTPFTDMGTVIGILYQNAIPVFADLDPYNFMMDPVSIEERITPRTKAIVVVHLMGNAADMDAILEIAGRYNLYVIEDCAQSFLTTYKGRLVGTIGHIGCFSLNDFKHISVGDGGMVIMNDEELYIKAARFADKNYDRTVDKRDRLIDFMAPCYRMNELQGAVAIAQLDRLEGICDRRMIIGDRISAGIKDLPGVTPPKTQPDSRCTYWFYMFRLDPELIDPKRFNAALEAEGVLSGIGYTMNNMLYDYGLFANKNIRPGTKCPFDCPYYDGNVTYDKSLFPQAEEIVNSSVCIPMSEFYTDDDVDEIIAAICKVSIVMTNIK